jgi:hypothetical protein
MMVAMASFGRSQHRCKLQKLLAIYFRSNGLSARAFDTAHALGISMSHSWVHHGVDKIAEEAIQSLRNDITKYKFCGTHDNINIPFRTSQQRLNNQSHFDSGTAATIYLVKNPSAVPPNNQAYNTQFQAGSKNPITYVDILKLDSAAAPRLRERGVYIILSILLQSKPFDFCTYKDRDSVLLQPPSPVLQLPTGREHATHQAMLGTVHKEEASYDGNEACMNEWMKQLGLDSLEKQKVIGREELIVWIGDQLTVSRLRGLKRYHSQDLNATQRLEHIVEIFGWFHAQITVSHSFHSQYYGTSTGVGLKRDFELLRRKGLTSPSVAGTFHDNFTEALTHVAEAKFRDLWCVVGGVENLAELRSHTPEELRRLANKIHHNYATTAGLIKLHRQLRDEQDDVLMYAVQFNRDILVFLDLEDAIKTGDVGRMRDLIPRLLFRFIGGRHPNYTIEFLEVLQALENEWPDDLM